MSTSVLADDTLRAIARDTRGRDTYDATAEVIGVVRHLTRAAEADERVFVAWMLLKLVVELDPSLRLNVH